MKRTFKSLLAAAALAFIGLGSLLVASPAQAYTWIPGMTSGSNTNCYGLVGSNFPESTTGTKFVYCGPNPPINNTALSKTIEALSDMPSTYAKTFLANGAWQVVYSETFMDYCKASYDTPPSNWTTACNGIYNTSIGQYGVTGENHITIGGVTTFIHREIPGFSGSTLNDRTAHTVLHEAGHAYELLHIDSKGDSLSQRLYLPTDFDKTTFLSMLGADRAHWNWNLGGRWNTNASNLPYFFAESPSHNYRETFAEIFAMGAAPYKYNNFTSADTWYWPIPNDLDAVVFRDWQNPWNGLLCAEIYVWEHMNYGSVTYANYAPYGVGNRCIPNGDLNHHIGG